VTVRCAELLKNPVSASRATVQRSLLQVALLRRKSRCSTTWTTNWNPSPSASGSPLRRSLMPWRAYLQLVAAPPAKTVSGDEPPHVVTLLLPAAISGLLWMRWGHGCHYTEEYHGHYNSCHEWNTNSPCGPLTALYGIWVIRLPDCHSIIGTLCLVPDWRY
jgi:hypothetical protein